MCRRSQESSRTGDAGKFKDRRCQESSRTGYCKRYFRQIFCIPLILPESINCASLQNRSWNLEILLHMSFWWRRKGPGNYSGTATTFCKTSIKLAWSLNQSYNRYVSVDLYSTINFRFLCDHKVCFTKFPAMLYARDKTNEFTEINKF